MKTSVLFASFFSFAFAGKICIPPIAEVTIKGDHYKYLSLVGKGEFPSDGRDKFGDTAGGWGSGIAADVNTWKKRNDGFYEGILYAVPDRGWNTNGIFPCSVWLCCVYLSFESGVDGRDRGLSC
jgi:hypothetical protein